MKEKIIEKVSRSFTKVLANNFYQNELMVVMEEKDTIIFILKNKYNVCVLFKVKMIQDKKFVVIGVCFLDTTFASNQYQLKEWIKFVEMVESEND